MASVYASSPLAQAVTQARIGWSLVREATSGAMTAARRASQASVSRKNPVTLIIRSFDNAVTSSAFSRRKAPYSDKVSHSEGLMRRWIRRSSVGLRYPEKS